MDTNQSKLITLKRSVNTRYLVFKDKILKPTIRNGYMYIKGSGFDSPIYNTLTDKLGESLISYYNHERQYNDKLLHYLPNKKRELAKSAILYSNIFLLLNNENNLIGYIKLQNRKNTINVSQLFISEEYRRSGYGIELLQFAESFAFKENKEYLTISVYEENKEALSLYKKYDFK